MSHKIWSWTAERRNAELAKCKVKCHRCHVRHHAAERRARIQHGTTSGYDILRCRCEKCRHASRIYRHELRQRHQAQGANG